MAGLGADWVAAHGQGRLAAEQREELRAQLLQDIEARGGCGGNAATDVRNEVDLFLRNGRVSDSNLKRLEKRVFRLAGEGSLSARGEGARSVSEFSRCSTARPEPPQTARQASRQGNPELDALLRSLAPGGAADKEASRAFQTLPAVPEAAAQKLGKWSEVAKYAKQMEDREKEQHREFTRHQQQQMRRDLQLQMEEKKLQKQRVVEEDKLLFKHQEAELERWRQAQDVVREEAKSKALQVNQEREVQRSRRDQLRQEEADRKREEDHRLVQKAAQEMDMEVKMLHDRKMEKKAQQKKMADDMREEGKLKDQERKIQAEEDKRKANQYFKMLEEQQARNRKKIVIRTPRELRMPDDPKQRAWEVYSDENLTQQLLESNRRAEQEEIMRMERVKSDRHATQDFLSQQIAERDRLRRQVKEQKGSAKAAAQDATQEYLAAERKRIEEQRTKNVTYRLELEQQISAKRAGQQPRQAEDQMTRAERAINQRLLREVVELRGDVGALEKQAPLKSCVEE